MQRLSSEVSRKVQEYTQARRCSEFMRDNEEELSVKGICKAICDFSPSLDGRDCHVIFWPVSMTKMLLCEY